MKRRIAYYLATAEFGGVELSLSTILRHLDRRRFEPRVYLRCENVAVDVRVRAELARLEIPVQELDAEHLPAECAGSISATREHPPTTASSPAPGNPWKKLATAVMPGVTRVGWYHWRTIRRVAAHFKRERLDVMHFLPTYYPSLEIPMLASWAAQIPVRICDIQTEPMAMTRAPWIRRLIARSAVRRMTAVRVLSQDMARLMERRYRAPRERLRIISIGIDVERFQPATHNGEVRRELGVPVDGKLVVCIARLSPEKGHAYLIDAAARLRERHPDAYYVFAGEGPMRGELETRAAAQGLGQQVRFVGFRRDIPELLAAADVLALPSLTEGMPWVVLEAMAAAKPVIASRVGGVPEILMDPTMGRLVTPGSVGELSGALDELLSEGPATWRRLGQMGRRHVEAAHSEQKMLEQLLACYRS